MEYLDLTNAKECRLTKLGRKFVLMALVTKKSVAQLVGNINVDQSVGENPVVQDKTKAWRTK